VRRDALGTSVGDEAAWREGAPYRPAALAAATTFAAGAPLSRHRRIRLPPADSEAAVDAGAPIVQLASVASGAAVG
jgi:hypothetical protein